MSSEKESLVPGKKEERQFKTDGGKTKSNAIEIPTVSLPKGGGALRGIDQKFSVNAVNGTAAFSIPLPVSAARGAAPSLALSYNSGGGNGIFGLGWNLSLPSIKRKTDKMLPQYNDAAESDVYLISEAEDLVPEYERHDGVSGPEGTFKMNGDQYVFREDTSIESGWTVRFYKPRIEGLFARIERWTEDATGDIKWRVISRDNTITLYGWHSDGRSRICDPANQARIYEWLPEMVIDDKGNCAVYKYLAEDDSGIDLLLAHNRNRYDGFNITYTNRYLEKVLYGNMNAYAYNVAGVAPIESDFMFQTVFDYGQYDSAEPYGLTGVWDFRNDPFSEYKSGFEIRTTRLCKRVLLFHYFPALIDGFALVKSMDFTYSDNDNEGFSFLNAATSKGYIKLTSTTYSSKSLPEMEFTYQAHAWSKEVKEITTGNLLHSPNGITSPYQFTDLYNEGLSGILSEQGGAWYYKRNLGEGNFEATKLVSPKPSFSGLNGSLQLVDLDGDGTKQIVSFSNSPQGYFEITDDEEFQRFRNFSGMPNINLNDPNTRLIDLNGDGKTDLLITEDSFFTWYESDGRNGFKERYRTPNFIDEEQGPCLVFADSTQSIFLADMSGDGLVDLVRIRNGEVCYWPNLGYGNFGAKVSMDNAPVFDSDHDFNPGHIKIADIDGSGTPDLIYLGKNKFSCWLNLSGNAYSTTPFEINGFPKIDSEVDINLTDLLGNGLSCIVWSSSLQKDAQAPLRYIDLMDSKKPHMMMAYKNNMGKEVELEYTPSTKFYIADKLAGNPWVTKLHFPVYCLSKVITMDKVTGHRFTSNYTYHHGYYDHAEKEFRGFGRVDQTDLENFEHWINDDSSLEDSSVDQAPVLTRSWFHTGAWIRDKKILDQFANEYWYVDYDNQYGPFTNVETALPGARIVPDGLHPDNQDLVDNMSPVEQREAYRSCKSLPLRTEVFSMQGTEEERLKPYLVSTHNCMIELLQPQGQNRNAVYCVKESEAITYNYDRNIDDPRIAHSLNLEMDLYGNVLKSASVVYPRLVSDPALPAETQAAQAMRFVMYTENEFTNDVWENNKYRLRAPFQSKTYEITGSDFSASGDIFTVSDFDTVLADSDEIGFEDTGDTDNQEARLIEHVKSLYYADDLSGPLNDGELEARGLPYESYQKAYAVDGPSDMIDSIYNTGMTRVTNTEMNLGQFEQIGNDWWIRSGTIQYISGVETAATAFGRFFTPISFTDPFGTVSTVSYDSNFLFIDLVTDAAGNETLVQTFDYRTLSPVEMMDMNDNLSAVILDELGLPKAMAVYGKGTQADELTNLYDYTDGGELAAITNYFDAADADLTDSTALMVLAENLLQHATLRFVYDFHRYKNSGGVYPVVVSTIAREEHYAINSKSPLQLSFEYSGGLESVVMKKVQAEPGEALQVTDNGDGTVTVTPRDTSVPSGGTPFPALRWIGNGRNVLNNKGKAVKQYEPYFSVSAKYESAKELVEQGVTPVMYYDAIGRLIKTEFPDKTYSKVEFDSWKQEVYDANDTCMDSEWYSDRIELGSGPDYDAAVKAAAHADTPGMMHFDTLGRVVLQQEVLTTSPLVIYDTKLVIDAEGNLRKVIDARDNTVMEYKYDMLGNMVYQLSMDSGERWLLQDAMGAPLRSWDQLDHEIEYAYDSMHRPLTVTVNGGPDLLANVVEEYIYGEGQPSDKALNLRGKLYRHYDTAGLEETAEYDFKGSALSTERWLAADYKNVVNWAAPSALESTSYTIATTFDAFGRISLQTAPDGSIITPSYSERGVLVSEKVNQGAGDVTHLVAIHYDAKGQRTYVKYGNDVYTSYTYDPLSFRLTRLLTQKSIPLQDQYFTYDAVGNITRKRDAVNPDVFYDNNMVSANNDYTYDALYRLIEATGRESKAGASFGATDNYSDAPFLFTHMSGNSMVTQSYTQEYQYDQVGNILQLRHTTANVLANYTRDYVYNGTNNQLIKTTIGGTDYNVTHDPDHGFITSMPHLSVLQWNWKEEIVATSKQAYTAPDIPETTYYQYDSKGTRLRKITENYAASPATPTQKDQRIYIAGWEFYEDFGSTDTTETLSLIDQGNRFVMIENSSVSGLITRYQHPNHQGSCTLETDENGHVITYEEYHPFGTTSYQAKNSTITAAAKRYRYTGMERDDESGLSYHNARYYISWLGRWMNPDPIGIGDGVNVYAYCGNNPVGYLDSEGTQTKEFKITKEIQDKIDKYSQEHTAGTWELIFDPKTGGTIEQRKSDKLETENTEEKKKDTEIKQTLDEKKAIDKNEHIPSGPIKKEEKRPDEGPKKEVENAIEKFYSKNERIVKKTNQVAPNVNSVVKVLGGIGKVLADPKQQRAIQAATGYATPKATVYIPKTGNSFKVPTKVLTTASKFFTPIAKAVPLVTIGASIIKVVAEKKVTVGDVVTIGVTVATMVLAAPVAAVVGIGFLAAQYISKAITGKTLTDNLSKTLFSW